MNEAAWIVESGDATIETVDSTTKFDMGLPMGSFELADQVGIDVGYHVLEYMHEVLGEAYRPCPLLVEKVEAEELGKKTGSGFYDYENGGAGDPHGRDRRRCPQTPARGDGQRGRRTRRQRRGRRARDRSCRDARRRIPGRSRKARR